MSPRAIHLRVLTESHLALADEAVSIVAPGGLGYLGMLYNHAPLITTVSPGRLRWITPSGTRRTVEVGSGLLELVQNRCTLLTNSVTELSAAHA